MDQSTTTRRTDTRPLINIRGLIILGVFLFELLCLAIVYQFFVTFECGSTDSIGTCRFLRSLVARSLVVFATFGILVWARPALLHRFAAAAARHRGHGWMGLHLAGVALLWMPLILTGGDDLGAGFRSWTILWTMGSAMAAIAGLFWIAAPRDWVGLLAQDRFLPLAMLVIAALVPDLADMILPIWDLGLITEATFAAVHQVLRLFSATTYADAATYIIGINDFAVHIARQCSGVEGMALVTAFVLFYGLLFRDDLRLTRYWLTVLPLGLAFSVVLNVVRIAVLILIGAHISPDLAVNGFHSYAGWLFFTVLALVLVYTIQKIDWLHRDPGQRRAAPPLTDDPLAARILPFVVFMLTGIVTQALFVHPPLGYPLIVLGLALAVWTFRHHYRSLPWGLDPLAIGSGLAVGVIWVVLAERGGAEASGIATALATLTPALVALWIALRLIGTVLLVPLVEEMFFRGYILARLDQGGLFWRLIALIVSTVLFAALHGRWLEAALAGIVFALVMLRRGRVTDAVISHLAANATVAAAALSTGDFSLI